MFAAVRHPASRTASAYVCFACRSRQVTNPQQWRTLSTESHSTPSIQDLPPPSDLPSNLSEHEATSDGITKKPRPRNRSLSKPQARRASLKKKTRDADQANEDSTLPNASGVVGNAEIPTAPTLPAKRRKARSPQTAATKAASRSRSATQRAEARVLHKLAKQVPEPTFTRELSPQQWTAQVTIAGQVFECSHARKGSVRLLVQQKVAKYLSTLLSSDASGSNLGTSEVNGEEILQADNAAVNESDGGIKISELKPSGPRSKKYLSVATPSITIRKHSSDAPPGREDLNRLKLRIAKMAASRPTSITRRRARLQKMLGTFAPAIRKIESPVVRKVEAKDSPDRYAEARAMSALSEGNMTLKEALSNYGTRTTPRRHSASGPRAKRRQSLETARPRKEPTTDRKTTHELPTNVRGYFKPSEGPDMINATELEARPIYIPQPQVPPLSYGLDRVLFNPGVYRLRDPRSRVYNFDPYLEKVVPAAEFDFSALKAYKVASSDTTLADVAAENGLKYFTSTSSLTSVLMTFHFLISQWRPIDVSMLSKSFDAPPETGFTTFTKAPTSIVVKPKKGGYAIDKDDDGIGNTVLSLVGKSLEKLLTVPKNVFERYRKSSVTGESSIVTPDTDDAYHYTGIGNVLVRSQLDGHDPRLPGTGIFDIKTRAVLPIRMDVKGRMDEASSYELKEDHGKFESFEREFHDMLRSPMLKYSMQARLGRMDGIFVAYHNISRLFGFQYISLSEIDKSLHGQKDSTTGDQELRASIAMLGDILDRASSRFPDQPLRIHFETRGTQATTTFMNIFVEPVTDQVLQEKAEAKQRLIEEFENAVMFPTASDNVEESKAGVVGEDIQDEDAIDEEDTGESIEGTPNVDFQHRLARAQAAALELIRSASKFKDADAVDAKRLDRKKEFTKIMKATEELDKQIVELNDDLGLEEDAGEAAEQIERLREAVGEQMEENSKLLAGTHSAYADSPIMALALTVRNKVNGSYVTGPPTVRRGDEWVVEYDVQEMKDNVKAWERYTACKIRKENASGFSKEEKDTEKWYGGSFMQELVKLSQKGKEWRKRQDRIDEMIGKVTVFEALDKSSVSGQVSRQDFGAEEGVRDVNSYLEWLYDAKNSEVVKTQG